jgi:hypothetical protein
MGTRENTKGRPKKDVCMDGWKDGWWHGERQSVTDHVLTENNTIDRDIWRNLVLDKGKPLYRGQIPE